MHFFSKILGSVVAGFSAVLAASGTMVGTSLMQFDREVRNYNLISFGDASFTQYGDTEGGLAIGGNLFLDGGIVAAQPGKFPATSDPSLHVAGRLSTRGEAMLQSGYAAISGTSNTGWSWNAQQNRLSAGGNALSTINTAHARGDIDPRLNPAPAEWDFAGLRATFAEISHTLASAAATGSISVDAGQNLRFNAPTGFGSGPVVFDLDARLLTSNTYAGTRFSSLQFTIPDEVAYVINVRNAGESPLFGLGNFNKGSGYSRLLWNFIDSTPGSRDVLTLGNGGEFFGAILAPTWEVRSDGTTPINGQVVAGAFKHSGRELHYTGFDYFEATDVQVPEPSTYGLVGVAACAGLLLVRAVRRRRAS